MNKVYGIVIQYLKKGIKTERSHFFETKEERDSYFQFTIDKFASENLSIKIMKVTLEDVKVYNRVTEK